MTNANPETGFKQLYTQLGLGPRCEETFLPERCPQAGTCWRGEEPRTPNRAALEAKQNGGLSMPWVGPDYEETRLLILGINTNEYAHWTAMRELAEQGKDQLKAGRVRLYGTAWLGLPFDGDEYSGPVLADLLDRVAMTNHIKCAPTGSRSKPTTAMWEQCGPYILPKELELLRPTRVLVLGSGDNGWYFQTRVRSEVDSKTHALTIEGVRLKSRLIRWNDGVEALVMPHPSAPGGMARGLIQVARQAAHA